MNQIQNLEQLFYLINYFLKKLQIYHQKKWHLHKREKKEN